MEIAICSGVEQNQLLREAGVDCLEVNVQNFLVPREDDEAFAANLAAAEESILPLRAANGFLPAELRVTGPEVDLPAVLAYAETAFQRARRLGIEVIVFGSGGARNLPEGFSEDRAADQFVEVLQGMGPLAEAQGVTVAVEPLNRRECNFITSVEAGAVLVRRAAQPQIRLLADLYHMGRDNEPAQSLLDHGELLAHVHVAEFPTRTPPGVEGCDFGPYFSALARAGYGGRFSLECAWEDLPAQAAPAVADLRADLERAGF